MSKKYPRLLVTKLSSKTHERLKEVSKIERRTLSALSRNIIEDYLESFEKKSAYRSQ